MGLTTSLNNAVSGLRVNQDSLTILSRNVANQGTPGYHRQSLSVGDYNNENSSYARTLGTTRAFNTSLQTYYTRQVSDTANAGVQASYLERLGGLLGKPGSAGSLDTLYGQLQNAMQSLATSPDDYTVRAQALSQAQAMAEALNRLSGDVQTMRSQTEVQIGSNVQNLNGMLASLHEVNTRLLDRGGDDAARASLLDQRDRLVSSVAELIDVKADYKADGTVALMTGSGVGLVDGRAASFRFDTPGRLTASSEFNSDSALSGVGKLTLVTASGLEIDVQRSGGIRGGELGGLLTLRDKTLPEAQSQLDEIAAGLAQAFSTVQTPGTAVAGGFAIDVSGLQPGNDLLLKLETGSTSQSIKIVNTTKADVDYRDASGARVIGIDFAAGSTAAAAQLQAKFDSFAPGPLVAVAVSGAGNEMTFSATGPTTTVAGVTKRATSSELQDGGLGLSLFTDGARAPFTNSVDGMPPQKAGFAARISINAAVLADNRLLVQSTPGQSLGSADRANHILGQLGSMDFVSGTSNGRFPLNGNVGELISQTIGFQGSNIAATMTRSSDKQLTLDTVMDQMQSEYGVNVDEEMSRLLELQNAYAANARVVSVVKELLDQLFAST
ncbi:MULTISPECIES: flagellar hook-associated protein FlgK [unclassified Devosia]|uniref:flagellar hook-associated protein FlgK n=1 Tax=unclassified Devosia TaxID=196773 RepID=UPI00155753D1|nr:MULTISPECIES: flagellar hook-associated protein FlgK [unclassified Devosia]